MRLFLIALPGLKGCGCPRAVLTVALLVLLVLRPDAVRGTDLPRLPMLSDGMAATLPAIGRVNFAGYRRLGMCTGTLIAPDAVLTAAHCVMDGDGALRDLAQGRFVAGYDGGDYAALGQMAHVQVHPGFRAAGGADLRFDIAILRLVQPMAAVTLLPLYKGTGALPDRLALIGYDRHRPHRLSGALDCPRLRATDRQVLLGCPVQHGNSGGPVLIDENGEWQVIGVVSAQVQGDRAMAVRAGKWVRAALADPCRDHAGAPACD